RRPLTPVPDTTPLSPLFFFHPTATSEIYTLSLHDALPILPRLQGRAVLPCGAQRGLDQRPSQIPIAFPRFAAAPFAGTTRKGNRSEEHTSELQSRRDLVCRLLLEKKKYITQVSVNATRNAH